jgi:transcription initiation factor TFIID subunit 5
MPLDKNTLAASSGLLSGLVPGAGSVEGFNSATTLKLGPAPMTDKLKEQVVRTIQDDDSGPNGANGPNGTTSPGGSASALPNGHPNGDANGDVDMTDAAQDSRGVSREPVVQGVKLEPDLERDTDRGDLISPEEAETLPPVPAVFRIADLKREVEAVRDKRKMIRLGPNLDESKPGSSSSSATLPSVVAFTVFDGGEG